MNVTINEAYLFGLYKELQSRADALQINPENRYEVLKEAVIRRFISYGIEDIEAGQYERSVYVHDCVAELLEQAEQYDGPFYAENPEGLDVTIDGYSCLDQENRPVFLCGYNSPMDKKGTLYAQFRDFACNTIQFETGPFFMVFPKGTHAKWNMEKHPAFCDGTPYVYSEGDFEINLAVLQKEVLPTLKCAEEHNIAVSFLISPHYLPNWMYTAYPDIRSKNVGFLHYNIYHPKAKEMLSVYIKAVMSVVKDCKAIQNICITNEPTFNTMMDCSDGEVITHDLLPTEAQEIKGRNLLYEWQTFLKETYQTVEALNQVWNTDYRSFSDIGMPEKEETPHFYQWHRWNNRLFSNWHAWLADEVRKYMPDVPINAKIMPVFGTSEMPYHRRFVNYGVDPEEFADFSDISGNDAWSFEGKSHLPLSYKLAWYDLLSSIKKMPIDNSEDHIIEDRDQNYARVQAKRTYADIWQGAVHGRTITQIWKWDRSNAPMATANGSVLHRPDCIEAIGRAALDLNRLCYEATAIQNCPRRAAILWAKASRVYNREYTAEMFRAYEGLVYAGIRPYFITEDKIDRLDNYELLILPGVTNITQKAADTITAFAKNKPVLVIEKNPDTKVLDEFNNPLKRTLLLESAIRISSAECEQSPDAAMSEKISKCVKELLIHEIYAEAEDGACYNLEWVTTEFEGKTLLNLCNYDYADKKITIKRKDGTTVSGVDLISGKEFSETVEAKAYTPILLLI